MSDSTKEMTTMIANRTLQSLAVGILAGILCACTNGPAESQRREAKVLSDVQPARPAFALVPMRETRYFPSIGRAGPHAALVDQDHHLQTRDSPRQLNEGLGSN
jgi:hypothetical protein